MDEEQATILKLKEYLPLLESVDRFFKNGIFENKNGLQIKEGGLMVAGGVSQPGAENSFILPLVIPDQINLLGEKRALGFGIGVPKDLKGIQTEQIVGALSIQRGDKTLPTDNKIFSRSDNVQALNLTEILVYHLPYDSPGDWSFLCGLRTPILASTGRINGGGSVLTDISLNLVVNELAGAILNLYGTSTTSYIIASNTATTITITGTFADASNNYTYSIFKPVYLGAATFPWRRLYIKDDIRFGIGPTDLSYPTAEKVTFRLIKESDRALSCEAAFGSKGQATTVDAGFTLTWTSGYHILTGDAARTSDVTTAITDGAFIGQTLILQGTDDTNTIIIKNGANTKLTGDITLGANDTLSLIWDGSNWVETAFSNNV